MHALPQRNNGNLDSQHKEWLQKCLQSLAGHNANIDNDITAFFDNMDNHNTLPNLTMSGSITSSIVSTPNGDDSSFLFSSDLESEGSKETVQEKHSDEDREKEVSVEKDATLSSRNSRLPTGNRGQSPPCKRVSDTSPSQIISGENHPPPLPRKKRPMSGDLTVQVEESVHKEESGGYTIKDLVEIVKIRGRKGLYREYAYIKGEHPSGTFEVSK